MRVFCQVVEASSFSAAADRLQLSPSAVSKQITGLENRLGVRLLNRTTRRLSLTEEGEAFYQRSRVILADIEDAERSISDRLEPHGQLKINAPVGFGRRQIVPLLPQFMERYPRLRIDLELTDRSVNLLEEGVDVLIRVGPLRDSSLVARPLGEIERYVCAAPSYIDKHGAPRTPQELADHNCLLLNYSSQQNEWTFRGPDGGEQTVRVAGNFSVNINGVLQTAVVEGLGVARMASFMIADDLAAGRLLPLLLDYRGVPSAVNAVYPHRRHLSSKVRAFVDYLAEHFLPDPPWAIPFSQQPR